MSGLIEIAHKTSAFDPVPFSSGSGGSCRAGFAKWNEAQPARATQRSLPEPSCPPGATFLTLRPGFRRAPGLDMCPGGWPRYEAQWEECAFERQYRDRQMSRRLETTDHRGENHMHQNQSWFAGVDWASQKHDVWLANASGKRLGKRTFEHSGAGLAHMCDWLIATSGGKPEDIHVAIEVLHGPVVETLLDRGFKVYAINPRQLDRFRDRFSPAGAKDDSRDAETLSSSLRTDRRAFHQVALAGAAIVQLREWSRMADDLSADKIRQANRLREQLQRYYPQMLQLGSDLAEEWVLRLWEMAPTPAKAARLRDAQVGKLLKTHRIRRIGAAEVLAILKQPALTVAPGVTEAPWHISACSSRASGFLSGSSRRCTGSSTSCAANLLSHFPASVERLGRNKSKCSVP